MEGVSVDGVSEWAQWGKVRRSAHPWSPTRRYGETPHFFIPTTCLVPFLPLFKDIPERAQGKSRRASAHAAIAIYHGFFEIGMGVFLVVHEGINFIARPLSNFILATFKKTFQGNSLVRAG